MRWGQDRGCFATIRSWRWASVSSESAAERSNCKGVGSGAGGSKDVARQLGRRNEREESHKRVNKWNPKTRSHSKTKRLEVDSIFLLLFSIGFNTTTNEMGGRRDSARMERRWSQRSSLHFITQGSAKSLKANKVAILPGNFRKPQKILAVWGEEGSVGQGEGGGSLGRTISLKNETWSRI